MSYTLNQNQKDYIQQLRDSGQYDLAYRYIHEQIDGAVQAGTVSRETQRWFEWAEHINADDDSLINAYARTFAQLGASANGQTLTNQDFQNGSDEIALSVLQEVLDTGIIPTTPENIILKDISEGSDAMGTNLEDFPGTLIAGFMFDTPTLENLILNDPNSSKWEKVAKLAEQSAKHAMMLGGLVGVAGAELLQTLRDDPRKIGELFDALNDIAQNETLQDVLGEFFDDLIVQPIGYPLAVFLDDLLAPLFGAPGLSPPILQGGYSPLVLDINGNNQIDLISIDDSEVYFDLWGDGFRKKFGWIDSGDGLLALDKNANGQIDDMSELFGSNYPLGYLSQLTDPSVFEDENGFAKLAAYDSNDDGIISSLDTVWSDLTVWLDSNQNGVTDEGELFTLDSLNIASIDVDGYELEDFNGFLNGGFTRIIEGNIITHTSSFTMTDSTVREIVDVWFEGELQHTRYAEDFTLDINTLFLPTARGYGQLPDLHVAASIDNGANGLLEQLKTFAVSNSVVNVFSDFDTVRTDVEDLLFTWGGIDAAGIRANQDYSEAGLFGQMPEYFFIQKFLGQDTEYLGIWYDQSAYTPRTAGGVEAISDTWENILDAYTARLVFQVGGDELFEDAWYNPSADAFSGSFGLSQSILDQLETEASSHLDKEGFWNAVAKFIDQVQGVENLSIGDVTMLDTAISDSTSGALDWDSIAATLDEQVLYADDGGDTVNGTRWDDHIIGGDGNDVLIGGDGNDYLLGGNAGYIGTNDVFDGGAGDDIYVDGWGDDIYKYESGHDVIDQANNGSSQDFDIIEFSSGINVNDVSLHISQMTSWSFRAWHVALEVEERGSIAITAMGYGSNDVQMIDELHFADSTVLSVSDLTTTYHGQDNIADGINTANWATDGDIIVFGYGGNDNINVHSQGTQTAWIDGGEGDDYVYGSLGDDTLFLSGGNDQFVGVGGENTILLPENYTLSDVSFYRFSDTNVANPNPSYQNDALIQVDGLGSVSVLGQFTSANSGSTVPLVQTLQFHDGSTVDLVTQRYITIGTSGDDNFNESGNWFSHDDTYLFGEGNDVIHEYNGTDTLLFAEGISFNDLTIYREDLYSHYYSSDHLVVEDSNGNSMKVHLQFYTGPGASYAVEKLEFADSTIVNVADLEIETRGDDTDNQISGFDTGDASSDDTIYAYDGNDDIYAYAGNDLVYGGAGNDDISGGDGADALYGDEGHDEIDGNAGADTIDGGSGSDIIDAGADNDTIIFTVADNVSASDTINGGTGEDTLRINISSSEYSVPLYNDIQAFNTFVTNNYNTGTSSGAVYSFEYIGLTASNIEHVDVYVDGVLSSAAPNPSAMAPEAYDDAFYGQSDQNLNGNVLDGSGGGKDFDFNNDTLTVTSETKATSQGGSVTINSDGSFTYTPATSFAGLDTFDYTVSDGSTNDIGSVTLNITNEPPPNLVTGTAAAETLYGTTAVDLIDGQAGDDILRGNEGDDIYVYNSGDGNDTITDTEGSNDTLLLGQGITEQDIRLVVNGTDLEIYHGSSKIILDYHFHSTYGYEIENLTFADGSSINLLGNLTFTGTSAAETLAGQADRDDTLIGAGGDDTLYGYQGDDTYIYNSGDGNDIIIDYGGVNDTLVLGQGITEQDIRFVVNGTDLEIYHGSSKIILDYHFHSSYGYEIENLTFADGSSINLLGNLTFTGTSAAETLAGQADRDDTLLGAGGDDTLYGYQGDDTYIYNSGDGSDIIVDYGGSADVLEFGAGIMVDDLRFVKNGYDLDIHLGYETITLDYQLHASYGYEIETAEFADGTSISLLNNLKFEGTEQAEIIYGDSQNDILYGYGGDDTLNSQSGDDVLYGGQGNDTLYGGLDDDVYVYNPGDGTDFIQDAGGAADKLVFGLGITSGDIRLLTSGQDLEIHIGAEKITLDYQFNTSYGYEVEAAEFADGSTLNLLNNLTFTGDVADNSIYGLASKDDTLIGGAGDDSLYGASGDDTYLYNLGDGTDFIRDTSGTNDRLKFGQGITSGDIRLLTSGQDLEIHIGAEKITLDKQFNSSYGYGVETAEFADGSTLDLLNNLTFTGDVADNSIYGLASKDDTLIGGAGDDSLYGASGDDTYLYNLGDGTDFIRDTSGTADKLLFGAGIDAEDLTFVKNGQDLEIHIGAEKITLDKQFNSSYGYEIETAEFADGSTLDLLNNLTFAGTSGADSLQGSENADVLLGLAGADTLYGNGGNDTINGGVDNDTLYGGYGDDTYVYNTGDASDDITDYGGSADELAFGAGITANDLHFASNGNDLIITIGTDTITIDNQFHTSYGYEIETASFADSSTLDLLNGLTFAGTDNAESLYGSNRDDVIYGDEGADDLYGYAGADTFLYLAEDLDGSKDTIHDFSTGENDALDISDLIEGYDPVNDAITDFVWLVDAGSDTNVYIDQDGSGTSEIWTQIATINNVTGLTDEAALESNGTLITV